ncbi:MAG TPA: hypothetical protein PKK26_03135 [Candidatus Wallbacteria bacterium]|nr:hypothetical protein [Candidatus Wallbacteria bacterium]
MIISKNRDVLKKRTDFQKGISYIIIIGILFTLLIAVASFSSLLRNERYFMYKIIYGDNALIIAEVALDILQKIVEDEFSKTGLERNDKYFKYSDLIAPKEEFKGIVFDSVKLTKIIRESKPVQKLISVFGSSSIRIVEVKASIDKNSVKYYCDGKDKTPGISPNPHEKYGMIVFQVDVEFYSIRRTLTVKKQFKLVNILPKALRFFTLFVKTIPNGTDLNGLLTNKEGKIISGKPLVLYNGAFNREQSPLNLGIIFLGNTPASTPINLRLSHGSAIDGAGELFQLNEDFYIDPHYKSRYSPFTNFRIGHLDYGICTDMAKMPQYGISGNLAGTSILKLFGTASNPSPTRVLGNVFRSYLKLSVYQDLKTSGKEYMCEIPFLDTPADFVNPAKGAVPIAEKGETPPQKRTGLDIARKIFPSYYGGMKLFNAYKMYMNQIIDWEPYNYSLYNKIKDKHGLFCDQNKIPDLITRLFPESFNNFGGKPCRPADSEFTNDDLRKFIVDDKYILPYISFRYPGNGDFEKFKSRFIETAADGKNTLKLGMVVLFDASVTLPAMTVARGGIIVCRKGNIIVSGDIVNDPVYRQSLTLIALEGDIIINANRFDGIIISMGEGSKFIPQKFLNINGGLAVNSLDFQKLASLGGNIAYNTYQSLPQNDPGFYYASIQPDVRNWEAEFK